MATESTEFAIAKVKELAIHVMNGTVSSLKSRS
jgi:hypothetical protein